MVHDRLSVEEHEKERGGLSLALADGDPANVQRLLDAGAYLGYSREGYGALLDAVHGRDIRRDPRLLSLLSLLVDRGARLNDITQYEESALRVLSNRGRFDGVKLLLDAGENERTFTLNLDTLVWSSLVSESRPATAL